MTLKMGITVLEIQKTVLFNLYRLLYCFYCNFGQINAALVSKQDFFPEHSKIIIIPNFSLMALF